MAADVREIDGVGSGCHEPTPRIEGRGRSFPFPIQVVDGVVQRVNGHQRIGNSNEARDRGGQDVDSAKFRLTPGTPPLAER